MPTFKLDPSATNLCLSKVPLELYSGHSDFIADFNWRWNVMDYMHPWDTGYNSLLDVMLDVFTVPPPQARTEKKMYKSMYYRKLV